MYTEAERQIFSSFDRTDPKGRLSLGFRRENADSLKEDHSE